MASDKDMTHPEEEELGTDGPWLPWMGQGRAAATLPMLLSPSSSRTKKHTYLAPIAPIHSQAGSAGELGSGIQPRPHMGTLGSFPRCLHQAGTSQPLQEVTWGAEARVGVPIAHHRQSAGVHTVWADTDAGQPYSWAHSLLPQGRLLILPC